MKQASNRLKPNGFGQSAVNRQKHSIFSVGGGPSGASNTFEKGFMPEAAQTAGERFPGIGGSVNPSRMVTSYKNPVQNQNQHMSRSAKISMTNNPKLEGLKTDVSQAAGVHISRTPYQVKGDKRHM